MVSQESIDAMAVADAVRILRWPFDEIPENPVEQAWRQHAASHLLERLDRDLRGGEQRVGQPASDDVRVLVLLEALKAAGDALLEAAQTFKDKARLPMPANRAHQAGQQALAVHKDVSQG